MTWFLTAKPGDKIVCIDDEIRGKAWAICAAAGCRYPEKGRIYSIRHIGYSDFKGHWCLRLVEIVNPEVTAPPFRPGEPTFHARRFRPLVSRPTNISVFTALLRHDKQTQKEPA
jgi:hypothetical protein